jgi:RNA polymerase sigma-B factor
MEIAVKLGISQMHVSRLLSRALTWLREAMLSDAPLQWQAGPIPSEPQDLVVRTRVVGTVAVVEVAGEVDRDTAARLRDTLLAAVRRPVRQVCVNLTRVPLMDAAGIAALLVGLEAARGADVRLRFSGLQPHVLRALRAVGIQPLVEAG